MIPVNHAGLVLGEGEVDCRFRICQVCQSPCLELLKSGREVKCAADGGGDGGRIGGERVGCLFGIRP